METDAEYERMSERARISQLTRAQSPRTGGRSPIALLARTMESAVGFWSYVAVCLAGAVGVGAFLGGWRP